MKEEKFKKIVVGFTAAAVMLLVMLLVFLMYQLIAISVRNRRIAELKEQYEYWEQYVEENQGKIEVYEGLAWLEIIARKLGMLGEGDFIKDNESRSFNGCVLKISDSGEFVYEICGD